ncbi:MAG: glycosyltransferase family 4 protein [Coriobacteriales bacterium]|jgi:glycosyltransferase involved in cell wall biosynthesis|nr:glycosyltransferase family 4 protein [Coriobacteriales bacterium]
MIARNFNEDPTLPESVVPGTRKHLLVVSSVWPHVEGSFEAANVVVHSVVAEIAAAGEFDLSYAYVNAQPVQIPPQAEPDLAKLRAAGVSFLDPLLLPPPSFLRERPFAFIKALFVKPESILFGHDAGHMLRARAQRQVDAVLTIWTEIGLNAASHVGTLRFAYHGNPDHKVFDAQHEVMRLVGAAPRGLRGAVDRLRRGLLRSLLERAHLTMLRRYTFVADIAANDATYYASRGINAFYLANMWPMSPPADWEARRDTLEASNPGKIIGSVGNLSATGNSLGFIALGKEVLPALERKLKPNSFKIHIFGGREPKPFLKPLLAHPAILVRGFVDDLNAEIISAPIFLISNNHHNFKVSHTRFLHAWSLGACVVAFRDCRDAMPEIEHGHNALLGDTAEQVAALVAQAMKDRELRRRLGRGGIETLQQKFSPATVTRTLIERMKAAGLSKG